MKTAMAEYLQELAEAREMFDSLYDDIKSGRVKPIRRRNLFLSTYASAKITAQEAQFE